MTKALLDTQPRPTALINVFEGNGGFTYAKVNWTIHPNDEGVIVEHDGQTFMPAMADPMSGTTTFVKEDEYQAWKKWINT